MKTPAQNSTNDTAAADKAAAAEAEKKRLADEAEAAEKKRLADEAEAAEKKRLADEAEAAEKKRLADEAAEKLKAEQEALEKQRLADQENLAFAAALEGKGPMVRMEVRYGGKTYAPGDHLPGGIDADTLDELDDFDAIV